MVKRSEVQDTKVNLVWTDISEIDPDAAAPRRAAAAGIFLAPPPPMRTDRRAAAGDSDGGALAYVITCTVQVEYLTRKPRCNADFKLFRSWTSTNSLNI